MEQSPPTTTAGRFIWPTSTTTTASGEWRVSDVSRGTCLVFTCPRGGRTEQGYCSVSYVAYDSTSFRISNTIPSTSAAIAQIGENMYVLSWWRWPWDVQETPAPRTGSPSQGEEPRPGRSLMWTGDSGSLCRTCIFGFHFLNCCCWGSAGRCCRPPRRTPPRAWLSTLRKCPSRSGSTSTRPRWT